ncbi:MAG: 1-acyl-sn-glycerol-3-phosphate acyltransferase [Deltaproteobacteria bacterium]|nr:1-acyl-sn-glycerol-3-phosphate acyltransferase [Deltaproteobacteria bacterium]
MLTPAFFTSYHPLPSTLWWPILADTFRPLMRAVGHHVVVEGAERLPRTPALLCTNSTQRYDFLSFLRALDLVGHRAVTISKAKNFHAAPLRFVMQRAGVVPIVSRGYLLLVDFTSTIGRRPTDDEYRALRRYLDVGTALPEREPFTRLLGLPRSILGHSFEPSRTTLRTQLEQVYASSMTQTLRLARQAVEAGFHVHIYPEGTVSERLGRGRSGAVQLARALGVPLVPVGMSGCRSAWIGATPLPRGGRVTVRVGEPLDVRTLLAALPATYRPFCPDDERAHRATLDAATALLMDRIEGLLDAPYRRPLEGALPGKGTRAFL